LNGGGGEARIGSIGGIDAYLVCIGKPDICTILGMIALNNGRKQIAKKSVDAKMPV
jgi:hypothetical protein